MGRLVTEAGRLGAVRLFFHRRTQVLAIPATSACSPRMGGSPIDEADPDNVDLLHDGIVRHAEEVEAGDPVRASGIPEVSGDERLIGTKIHSNQAIAALEPMLASSFRVRGSDRPWSMC